MSQSRRMTHMDDAGRCGRGLTARPIPTPRGFTLIELVLALAVAALLAAIAIPSYGAYVLRARISAATSDIGRMQLEIDRYALNQNGQLPPDLTTVNLNGRLDPWGRPYVYLRLGGTGTIGAARKDKNLVPINSDYDLYSSGPDGQSQSPLTAMASRDDIVRANNGSYIGVAANY